MTDTRQRTTLGTRFRFLVRAVGLTGLLALFVGAAMALADAPTFHNWDELRHHVRETLNTVLDGEGSQYTRAAVFLALGGLSVAALAVLVELVGGLATVTGRRTAANTSATVGTL